MSRMPVKIVSKPCKRCGVMMVDVPNNRWYCPECKKAQDNESKARFAEKEGRKKLPTSKQREERTDQTARAEGSHKAITEVNERAAAAGLSYGHMVALERTQKEDATMQEKKEVTAGTLTATKEPEAEPKTAICDLVNRKICEQIEDEDRKDVARKLIAASLDGAIEPADVFLILQALAEYTGETIDWEAIVKLLIRMEAAGWND